MDAQGSQTNAKPDTVGLWLADDLVTDLGQYADDLTVSPVGSWGGFYGAFRDADTTRQLTGEGGREVFVQVDLSATKDKDQVLIALGAWDDPGTATFAIALNSTAQIECIVDGATSTVHTFSVLTSAVQVVSICWSTRANPDTTGASDALISELSIYGHTDAAFEEVPQWTHAIGTIYDPGVSLSIGGYGNAFGWILDSRQVHAARVGAAWHTNVEFAEDWIAPRTAHGSALPPVLEPLVLGETSQIGRESELIGAANIGAVAASANANRLRMLTNLINEVYSDARTLSSTPSPTQRLVTAPGSAAYKIDASTLRWIPHPGLGLAWVRVHVMSWVTAGAAVPIGVRCYAFNRPPLGVGPMLEGFPTPALELDYVGAVITVDHGSTGIGEWLDLGVLRVPRFTGAAPTWSGTTILALAHAFDPASASANDANARIKIKAWDVRPLAGPAQ